MRDGDVGWLGVGAADHLPDDARFTQLSPVRTRLPVLDEQDLQTALATLSWPELKSALRTRLLPLPGGAYAACSRQALRNAKLSGLPVAALGRPKQFLAAVESIWGFELSEEARTSLHIAMPAFSAQQRFSFGQKLAGLMVIGAIFGALFLIQSHYVVQIASAAVALLFFIVVAFRMLMVLEGSRTGKRREQIVPDELLPVYSVLVPLHQEWRVLERLLGALGEIDYPPDRLDIKIIIEEFDQVTREALKQYELPGHFEIMVVPSGLPQTKPRALNYGLLFARGELLTIYDAEDLPAPTQLRKSAAAFAAAPPRLACLQARLTVFNANENWLTRQFALEYASLFGEILPALANLGLPLPLGGTSNHFRASCLRAAGGWDPYNVTEDADLGIRLSRLGYATSTIDSETFEEACITLRDWTRQRARWLKGFLQTWLVHMRSPFTTYRQLGGFGCWVFHAVTLGVFVSALLHPVLLAHAIWNLKAVAGKPQSLLSIAVWQQGYSLMILLAGYATSIWIAVRTMRRRAMLAFWSTIVTLPIYWLLLTPTAWLALWQFATDLHGWNKTPHGKSRLLA